jgi:YtkA-like
MRIIQLRAVALATGLFFGLLAFSFTASAASVDYQLVPLEQRLPIGKEVTLTVRLLHAATSKPVPGAVIFRTRLDMSPEGMDDMVAPLTPVGADEPATWRYTTRLAMAGDWAVTVLAKVPGETETVRASAIITGVEQTGADARTHGH